MVEETRFINNTVRIRYHVMSMAIAQRTPPEVLQEQVIVNNRLLALFNAPTHGMSEWMAGTFLKWRAALQSENRRIRKVLKQRATEVTL